MVKIYSKTVLISNREMPEASKSNVHGFIHGSCAGEICNTGEPAPLRRGVEEPQVNK